MCYLSVVRSFYIFSKIYIVIEIFPPNRFELEFRVPLPTLPPHHYKKASLFYDTPYTRKTFRLGNLETVCGLYTIWLLQNEMRTHIINTIFGNIKTTLKFSLYQINFDWPLVFNNFCTWLRNVLSSITTNSGLLVGIQKKIKQIKMQNVKLQYNMLKGCMLFGHCRTPRVVSQSMFWRAVVCTGAVVGWWVEVGGWQQHW